MSQQSLTLDDFSSHVGETFLSEAGDVSCDLQLVEAKPLQTSGGGPRQDPFTLLFQVDRQLNVSQGTFHLKADGKDFGPVVVVPVSADSEHLFLEAVFN